MAQCPGRWDVTTGDRAGRRSRSGWPPAVAAALARLPLGVHRWVPLDQRSDLRHALGRFQPGEDGYDLTPPPPAAGQSTGAPDYVGTGATAAGSGWWHRLVADHPAVSASPDLPPARHYLSSFATRPFGAEQVEEYHGWFPRRPGTIAGEWTPTYSALPWVAPLLARAAPGARILLMVRDPLTRLQGALSGSGERRVSQAGTAIADAFEGGFYGNQLAHLLSYVAADRVRVLQYEQCRADRDGQLAATYRFLGLDDGHRPERWGQPAPARPVPDLDPDTRDRLVDLYASDVAALVSLVPELDLSLWPAFDQV